MLLKAVRLAALLSALALVATGCRGCLRENVVWAHCFERPYCGPKPCPRVCPEFELPPGGPYLGARPAATQMTAKEQTREK